MQDEGLSIQNDQKSVDSYFTGFYGSAYDFNNCTFI